jgi:hypothetical protein
VAGFQLKGRCSEQRFSTVLQKSPTFQIVSVMSVRNVNPPDITDNITAVRDVSSPDITTTFGQCGVSLYNCKPVEPNRASPSSFRLNQAGPQTGLRATLHREKHGRIAAIDGQLFPTVWYVDRDRDRDRRSKVLTERPRSL